MNIGKSAVPYTAFAKWIGRWDSNSKMLRLVRFVWRRGEGPGFGKGYSAKVSLALTPRLVGFKREWKHDWTVTLFGIRLHYQRAYGGWIV